MSRSPSGIRSPSHTTRRQAAALARPVAWSREDGGSLDLREKAWHPSGASEGHLSVSRLQRPWKQ